MTKGIHIIFSLLLASLFTTCKEDEYAYPDLLTEMVCIQTNDKGEGFLLETDNGEIWQIPLNQRPTELTPDSTYRVLGRYERPAASDGTTRLYALHSVVSSLPVPEAEFDSIYMDKVSIQSIWRSGDYLNMILKVMYKDEQHELGFIENGLRTDKDGKKVLSLTLYHNRKDDIEGFYRKCYLSVPLWHYADRLNPADSIVFHLNTYEEGMTSRIFTY